MVTYLGMQLERYQYMGFGSEIEVYNYENKSIN